MKKVKRSEDMISWLPDPILGHILSYLTTEESVRTSILSKRWSSVWSYVPFIDLEDSKIFYDEHNKEQALVSSFIRFLNNAFSLHSAGGSLQRLTLDLSCGKFESDRVNEWVISAMRCKVKELDISIYAIKDFKLHVPLFAYQDLVSLSLCYKFVLDLPGEVLLPCLKRLYLKLVEFSDDESCSKLLFGCPVLELLQIVECDMSNVETLQIISPALKCLEFDFRDGFYEFFKLRVLVDAPFLEVLIWKCDSLASSYRFKNLGSLSDAYIDVFMDDSDTDVAISVIRKSYRQLLKGIADAKTIALTGSTLEALSNLDIYKLPLFNHLTKLELQGHHETYSTLIPTFLANSPFLQDLVLDLGYADCNPIWDFEWRNPVRVPHCLLHSLKTVVITVYSGQRNMLHFIDYLLSNGKVLDKLWVGRDGEKKRKELKASEDPFGLLLED